MWTPTIIASSLFIASTTSASLVGLLGRANRLCPAIIDTVTVTSTSTLSISVPGVTVTVTTAATPTVPLVSTIVSAPACLSHAQATSIVNSWKTILLHSDRSTANATAQKIIADQFLGTSDSINSLAGYPLSGPAFSGKAAFISSSLNAPAMALLTTLDIFHDCSRIAFYWAASGVGSGAQEVKGVDLLYMTEDGSQINMAMTEFNSLAWAKDVGWGVVEAGGTQDI